MTIVIDTRNITVETPAGSDPIVRVNGFALAATVRVRRLIALLAERPGEIVLTTRIAAHFGWPENGADNSAKVAVCHARAALRAAGSGATIVNTYGTGYALDLGGRF